MALYKCVGIVPADKGKFTTLVITGSRIYKHSFNYHVCIPFSSNNFGADLVNFIFLILLVLSQIIMSRYVHTQALVLIYTLTMNLNLLDLLDLVSKKGCHVCYCT